MRIRKIHKELADRLGRKLPGDWSVEQVRDYLDQATAAELDCTQLDFLTDSAIKVRDSLT
jgi:hypothetical protein